MPIEIETINLEYRWETTRSSGAADNVHQAPRNRDYACAALPRARTRGRDRTDKLKPARRWLPDKVLRPRNFPIPRLILHACRIGTEQDATIY